jgi:hypothetical protein
MQPVFETVIRPGTRVPTLAQPQYLRSVRLLLRPGGPRPVLPVTPLVLAVASHRQHAGQLWHGSMVPSRFTSKACLTRHP